MCEHWGTDISLKQYIASLHNDYYLYLKNNYLSHDSDFLIPYYDKINPKQSDVQHS